MHAGLVLATNAATAGAAFAAADFHLQRLTPREMYVAPGDVTPYVLRIFNDGDSADIAHLGDGASHFVGVLDDINGYYFLQSGSAGCGSVAQRFTGFLNYYQLVFDAGPIAPGSHLDCTLTIARDATSLYDTHTAWGVLVDEGGQQPYQRYVEMAYIGTLTDVSVQTQTFHFHIDNSGFAHATAELSVHNGGRVSLDPMIVGACEDTSGRPFFTDGSGPGGCGDDSYGPGCFEWSYGFITPKIEAGETYRCLIELTSKEPYIGELAFPIGVDFSYRSGGGFWLLDTDIDNDQTLLRLAPHADAGAAQPLPALTKLGIPCCGLALCGVASLAMRGRRERTFSRTTEHLRH